MAKYVLVEFFTDADADELVSQLDMNAAAVRGIFKKPTQFCNGTCFSKTDPEASKSIRGRKFGWRVCIKCHKPKLHVGQSPSNLIEKDYPIIFWERMKKHTIFRLDILPAEEVIDGQVRDWANIGGNNHG